MVSVRPRQPILLESAAKSISSQQSALELPFHDLVRLFSRILIPGLQSPSSPSFAAAGTSSQQRCAHMY